jgi:hypothetical protein
MNNLNATLAANNNVLQNRGTHAAQVPTFYGGNQDPIAWLNEFNLASAANEWNNARKLQIVPAYLVLLPGQVGSGFENISDPI